MLALLPVLSYALLVLASRRLRARRWLVPEWRDSFLAGAVLWGLAACGGAELLGTFGALTRGGVVALWLAVAAGAALVALRAPRPLEWSPPFGGRQELEGERALLLGIAGVALLVGVTAWAAAPNNWDSLTYHLPRVRHWIQDRSLGNYPTSILRQLTLAPGAEMLLTQLWLLSGSDRLWNLPQWGAWIGSIVAVPTIAARLGAGRAARVAAAVFAATLPMAILQGSSTQNDLILSFWLLTFVSFSLQSLQDGRSPGEALLAGGSLGLAALTKPTAYLFALPFLLWFAISLVRRRGARAAKPLVLAGAIVLLVNAGQWSRSIAISGSPLGPDYGTVNEARTPAILVSNLSRNLALHLAGPSDGWNRAVEAAVAAFHRLLSVGVDDPRSTWPGARFHVPAGLARAGRPEADEAIYAMFHDGQAGNPAHLLLLCAAGVLLVARRRAASSPLRAYLAAIAAGALLFCLVLRWQPWNSRLHLPLFLLGAPLTAAVLANRPGSAWPRRLCLILLLCALPWTLVNAARPLVGDASVLATPRLAQYFAEVPEAMPPFLSAGRAASAGDCRAAGLEVRPDDPEYLLWVALEQASPGPWRIEHVGVSNRSAALLRRAPFSGFDPCAVVVVSPRGGPPSASAVFSEEWSLGRVSVERRH
jgi:hypothetical protein